MWRPMSPTTASSASRSPSGLARTSKRRIRAATTARATQMTVLCRAGCAVVGRHCALEDGQPLTIRRAIDAHVAIVVAATIRPGDVQVAHRHRDVAVELDPN